MKMAAVFGGLPLEAFHISYALDIDQFQIAPPCGVSLNVYL